MKYIIELPEGVDPLAIPPPDLDRILANAKEAVMWDNEKHSIDGNPVKLYAVKEHK